MKQKIFTIALLIIASVCNGQVFPRTVEVLETTVCGSGRATIRVSPSQSAPTYKVYANNNFTTAIDSLPGSLGSSLSFLNPGVIFSLDGSKLKAGINTITVTGKELPRTGSVKLITPGQIIVDGIENEVYEYNNRVNQGNSTIVSAVAFSTSWSTEGLYIAVKVIDTTLNIAPANNPNDYRFDGVEIYIDPFMIKNEYNNNCNLTSCLGVRQLRINANPSLNSTFDKWPPSGRDWTGIISAARTFSGGSMLGGTSPVSYKNGTGYFVEVYIPWTTFFLDPNAVAPAPNFRFGFDVACNDNQFGTGRTDQFFWGAFDGGKWFRSNAFGEVRLSGIPSTSAAGTWMSRTEIPMLNVVTIIGLQTPATNTPVAITGTCSTSLTLVDISAPQANSINYWQDELLDQLNTQPTSNPKVYTSPITTTSAFVNGVNTVTGCWSKATPIELIPLAPDAISNPIKIDYKCITAEISATTLLGKNNLWYWQNSISGTNQMASEISTSIKSITGIGTSSIYLRSLNTITGCLSNTSAEAVVSITGVFPADPPNTVNGEVAGNCAGYGLTITGAIPSGDTWYWQKSPISNSKLNTGKRYITKELGYFYVQAEKQGCWSTITTTGVNVTDLGFPSLINQNPDKKEYCKFAILKDSSYKTTLTTAQLGTYRTFWQPNATTTSEILDASIPRTVTSSGMYYFRVKDTSGPGCWNLPTDVADVLVSLPSNIKAPNKPIGDTVACDATKLLVTSIAGVTPYWQTSPDGKNSQNAYIPIDGKIVTTSGVYYLRSMLTTPQNIDCWSDTVRSVNVIIDKTPSVPSKPTLLIAGCGATTITSTSLSGAGNSYFWQLNSTDLLTNNQGQNFVASILGSNIYYVRLKSNVANCWSDASAESFSIGVPAVPTPEIISKGPIAQNDTISVPLAVKFVEASLSTRWYTEEDGTASTSAPIPPTVDIRELVYYVTFFKDNCESPKVRFPVSIIASLIDLQPNMAITPNGDSKNETFVIASQLSINYPKNKLTILDKWGNLIFEKDKYDNSFDGKFNGNDLPVGTYYYVFDSGDGSAVKSGALSIFR